MLTPGGYVGLVVIRSNIHHIQWKSMEDIGEKTHKISCSHINPLIISLGTPMGTKRSITNLQNSTLSSHRHQPECFTTKPQWSTKFTRTWATTAHGQDLRQPRRGSSPRSVDPTCANAPHGLWSWLQVPAENGPMPLFIRGFETRRWRLDIWRT